MDERSTTEELNRNRAKTQEQNGLQTKTSPNKESPNMGLGIFMLMLTLTPGIGLIIKGVLRLQRAMGHSKNKNSLIAKAPGNISNVLSMFFIKSK